MHVGGVEWSEKINGGGLPLTAALYVIWVLCRKLLSFMNIPLIISAPCDLLTAYFDTGSRKGFIP